jgi:PKD repeat protein
MPAAASGWPAPAPPADAGSLHVASPGRALPLAFEPNRGQAQAAAAFVARSPGLLAEIGGAAARVTVLPGRNGGEPAVVGLRFAGGDPGARAEACDRLPGHVSYYAGGDPAAWIEAVPTYARIRFRDVYPGIDVEYRGDPGGLEYDLVVAPGADPAAILLAFDGAGPLSLDPEGNLTLCLGDGTLVQRAPSLYQDEGGVRHQVAGRFVLKGGAMVGFDVGDYDASAPLIIDPVVLAFSTFLGGNLADEARDVAVDPAGNIYVTGKTFSLDFPLASAQQGSRPQPQSPQCNVAIYPPPSLSYTMPLCQDSFVTKLSPDGRTLLYSTYLGGTSDDRAYAIAVDAAGNAHVVGRSFSTDFPTLDPLPDSASGDLFLTKLSPAGTLLFSSHLGPSGGFGEATDVAVGADGKVTVGGWTSSWSLPASPAGYWTSRSASTGGMCRVGTPLVHECTLGVLARVDLAARAYEFFTFVGQSGIDDAVTGIALAPDGGTLVATSGRLWKVAADASAALWTVALPATAVAADGAGTAYVVGTTTSPSLPATSGAFDRTCGSDGACDGAGGSAKPDVFVAKVAPDGSGPLWATYLGGAGADVGRAIQVDTAGHAVVVGSTASPDFPVGPGALDATCGSDGACNAGTQGAIADAFVVTLGASGQSLVVSTYLGGAGTESVGGVALHPAGDVVIAGGTTSADFPVASPFQAALAGADDAFVTRLAHSGCRFEFSTDVPAGAPLATPVTLAATLAATGCAGAAAFEWDFGDGSPHAFQEDSVHTFATAGTFRWTLTVSYQGLTRTVSGEIKVGCTVACAAAVPGAGAVGAPLPFHAEPGLADCLGAATYAWDFGDGSAISTLQSPEHAYAAGGVYTWTVTVTADGVACTRTGVVRVFAPPTLFADDFEMGLASWSVTPASGQAWGPSTHRAAEGATSAWCAGGGTSPAAPGGQYTTGMDTRLVYGPFSLAGTAVARATFAYWTKNHVWDYLRWGVSTDGQTFTWGPDMPRDSGGWKLAQVDLAGLSGPVVIGQPAVWFAFRFTSDSIWQDEGSYVDDVRIEAVAPQCLVSCSATVPATGQALVPVAFAGSAATDHCTPSWPSYLWDFGDGVTSTQTSPSHTYAAAGTYTWTLTASTAGVSCVRTGTIVVSPPPPCTVTCDAVVPATGFAGFVSAFQGTATASYCGGGPVGFSWSFGDGSPLASEEDPSHAYAAPGTYPWQMTASAGDGTCTRSGQIAIASPPPCSLACGATVAASAGTGAAVPFSGSVTPTLCHDAPTVRWAYGDGSAVFVGPAASHAYAAPGTYAWTMLAEADGARCVQSGTVAVSAQQVEVVLADGFEGDFPGAWAVSPPTATHWGPSTHRAAAGARSAYCAGGGTPAAPAGGPYYASMDTGMVFGPFSLAGATAARATFAYWLDTETNWDWFSWAVSVNGTSFYGSRTSGTATGWQTRELDLASVGAITPLGSPQVWLAFFFDSDAVVQREGVYVDDVRIERTLPGTIGCSVTCDASVPGSPLAGVAALLSATATPVGCAGPVGYAWDFGDGTPTSTQPSPQHTWTAAGRYLWQVTTAAGASVGGRSGVIDVAMPPVAPVRRHLRR